MSFILPFSMSCTTKLSTQGYISNCWLSILQNPLAGLDALSLSYFNSIQNILTKAATWTNQAIVYKQVVVANQTWTFLLTGTRQVVTSVTCIWESWRFESMYILQEKSDTHDNLSCWPKRVGWMHCSQEKMTPVPIHNMPVDRSRSLPVSLP
jgi:hypothetical protein